MQTKNIVKDSMSIGNDLEMCPSGRNEASALIVVDKLIQIVFG